MKKEQKNFKFFKVIIIIFAVVVIPVMIIQLSGKGIGSLNKLVNEMNITQEQAQSIEDILEDVGVEKINAVAKDEGLDDYYLNGGTDKGYRIAYNGNDTNDTNNTIIINIKEDGNVLVIKMTMGAVLYENGQVLDNLFNYRIKVDEQSDYQYFAQQEIKKLSKSPSTAEFPSLSEWKFSKDKGEVTLQAYVDSQNSYGATVRGRIPI
ncbi:MAG: hypothetical protein IJO33_04310 [Bacilli bacterium]|nr:hypothetical protein [Bacilli bacterium]